MGSPNTPPPLIGLSARWMLGLTCVVGLCLTYVFQRINWASALGISTVGLAFIVNKSIRFLLNDFWMLGVLTALFPFRKNILIAVFTQAIGLIVLLVPYFVLHQFFDMRNQTLAFLHRLVVNPILLLLLIPAFYIQQRPKN